MNYEKMFKVLRTIRGLEKHARDINAFIHPTQRFQEHRLRAIIKLDGKCPCDPDKRMCPCDMSRAEVIDDGGCKCTLFVGEKHWEKIGVPFPEDNVSPCFIDETVENVLIDFIE